MNKRKDGGLAFGGTRFEPNGLGAMHSHAEVVYPGMSLRDWFAGKALAGLCTAQSENGQWQSNPAYAAEQAYQHADAMIAERNK